MSQLNSRPMMSLPEPIAQCLRKYVGFSDRATRANSTIWAIAALLVEMPKQMAIMAVLGAMLLALMLAGCSDEPSHTSASTSEPTADSSLDATPATGIVSAEDDHGDDIENATAITVGESVAGAINSELDNDYFRFTAQAGQLYQVDVALGSLETLSQVELLYPTKDFAGNLRYEHLGYVSHDSDDQALRTIKTTESELGDYYVRVGGHYDVGAYTLIVVSSDVSDDHGDDVESATEIALGESIGGTINYPGEVDYFRFTADAGQTYQVDVALGTLEGSRVVVWRPSDGWGDTYNDDSGWEAPESGDYYVEVSGWMDGNWGIVGTYTLTVGLSKK